MRMAYINLFASSHNHDHGFKEGDTQFLCLPTTGQGIFKFSLHHKLVKLHQSNTKLGHHPTPVPLIELNCNHFPMESYFPCLDVEHCLSHSEQVVLLWEFKFLLEGRAQKYLFLFTVTPHYSSNHYHNFTAPFPCQESLEGFFGEGKSSISPWLP